MNKYIILIKECTVEDDRRFIAYVRSKGYGWWHWFTGSWIIATSENVDTKSLRDEVLKNLGRKYCLVMKVDVEMWAGFGPTVKIEGKMDMFDWIRKYLLKK